MVAYIVKQMLMSKSQLHPVMNPAAAGGNKIATCITVSQIVTRTFQNTRLLTMMRTTSDDLTIVSGCCCGIE